MLHETHEARPQETLTRVPYWVFQTAETYRQEQERIFQGPSWHYLALEVELREPGDFRTTKIGETPVVVVRDDDGEIYAFENRCAHRGALICLDNHGKGKKDFSCVYHAWTYDRQGDLRGIAFKDGVKGRGAMPEDFRMEEHGPRKLRIAILHGLIFGSFSEEVPPIDEYLGAEISSRIERGLGGRKPGLSFVSSPEGGPPIDKYLGEEISSRIERVLGGRKPVVLGRVTQALPNNWKLYMENVNASYPPRLL